MRDISDILDEWPYDPAACVRKIQAADGRDVVQVRTALGLEQYELDGRPDGSRPYDEESVLDHVGHLLARHIEECGGPEGFDLDEQIVSELQQEGLLYYYRYLVCFQIAEYDAVIRDTERNMKMFDFVKLYSRDTDGVCETEQYRPYVMRMHAAARALLAIANSDPVRARTVIRKAIRSISGLATVPTATFEHEKKRSLAILGGMLKALPQSRHLTEEELLHRELEKAVRQENYERAALLRDQLRGLSMTGEAEPTAPGDVATGDATA